MWERLKSLFTGDSNKRKKDEEERRRQQQASAPQKATPRNTSGGLAMPGSLRPEAAGQPLAISIVPESTDRLAGLSEQDRQAAYAIRRKGNDPEAFIQAAREAQKASRQSAYDNSLIGKAANFGRIAGGVLASEALTIAPDIGSRAIETVDRLATGNDDVSRYKKYEQFREGLDTARRGIAGVDLGSKQDIDQRAERISRGEGGIMDYGLGLLDSAEVVPLVGLAAKGVKAGVRSGARAGSVAARNLGGLVRDADMRHLGRAVDDLDPGQVAELLRERLSSPSPTSVDTPNRPPVVIPDEVRVPGPTSGPEIPAPRPQPTPPTAVDNQKANIISASFQNIEARIKRSLTQEEQLQMLQGQPPKTVVDEAAEIGSGISTPTTRQMAEHEVMEVKRVADAPADPALPDVPPGVIEPATPARSSLLDRMYEHFNNAAPPMGPRARQRGSIELPFGRDPEGAGSMDVEPSMEDLAKIEARGLTNADETPQNLEIQLVQEQIQRLDNLARQRSMAGVSERSLQPIYDQMDALEGELRRMVSPAKPTKAQQKAAAHNERVLEAQKELEKVVSEPPRKARSVVPETPAPKKLPVAKEAAPAKANKKVVQPEKAKTAKTSDKPIKSAPSTADNRTAAPKKATPKNKLVDEAKQAALKKEQVKQATKEQVGMLKKVKRATAKAEGKPTAPKAKAAPRVASHIVRDYDPGTELGRSIRSLTPGREPINVSTEIASTLRRTSKMSDDEILAASNKRDFGLGADVDEGRKAIFGAEGLVPRLRQLRETAVAANDLDRVKSATTAIDNIIEQGSRGSSEAGATNAVWNQLMKNAGPDYQFAKAKAHFEGDKVGGKMSPEQEAAFRKTYEDVYTFQKDVETIEGKIEDALKNLKKTKKSDIEALRKELTSAETSLENALAENKRIAGEIYDDNLKKKLIKDDGVGNWGTMYEGWAKAMMLSSPMGRARDAAATSVAMADTIAVDAVEALIGKAFKGKGLNQSMRHDIHSWIRGSEKGFERLRRIRSGEEQGGIYIDEGPNTGSSRKLKMPKTKLSAAPKKSNRFIREINTWSAFPTEAGRGYFENRVFQMADTIGRQKGYTGEQLEKFKLLTQMNPPKALADAAEQQFFQASSMHKNLMTDMVKGIDKWAKSQAIKRETELGKKGTDLLVRAVGVMTMPFKTFGPGSLQRLATDQNILYNPVAGTVKLVKGDYQGAARQGAHLAVNVGKLSAASALLSPFLVDTDGNNEDYNPPYLKFGETYIPLASLGPVLAAPLGQVWAWRKAREGGGFNAAEYVVRNYQVMMQSTGMDNVLAGDSPVGRLLSRAATFTESGEDYIDRTFGRLSQDIMTQWVPAGSRDMNAFLDSIIEWASGEEGFAPDTRVENEDGKKMHFLSGLKTVLAALPGVRQSMAASNPSDKANPTLFTRFVGGTKASSSMQNTRQTEEAKKEAAEVELERQQTRVSSVIGDDKIRGVLDAEAQAIYDRIAAGNTKKLKGSDYGKIESGLKSAEERFLHDSDYDTYLKAIKVRHDKVLGDPSSSAKDRESIEFDIKVAETLKEGKVDYAVYNMYSGSSKSGDDSTGTKAGISNSEMEKLLDPDSGYYDPETATALLELDAYLAERGISDNSLNTKRPKYARNSGGGGGGSSKGSKAKVITSVGSAPKNSLRGSSSTLQYRNLKPWESPIPNLSKQAARTNFKKNITVKKGVVL